MRKHLSFATTPTVPSGVFGTTIWALALALLLFTGVATAADREFKDECDGTSTATPGERGAWPNHFIDGGIKCDERKSETCAGDDNCWGGDEGADGVDIWDFDGDGDLDLVTGWEESADLRVYLNPLRNNRPYTPYAVPPFIPSATGRMGSQQWLSVDARGGKSVASIEDAIFADLDDNGSIDSVIVSTEGGKRDMQIHALVAPEGETLDPFNKDHWKAREFEDDGGKYYLQSAYGNVDGQNCLDVVAGAKNVEDGGQTIDGGLWWFPCPAGWAPGDPVTGDTKWNRHKVADGHWVMNLLLDDLDGDGHQDILFSDRHTVAWLENPCTAAAGAACVNAAMKNQWNLHLIEDGKSDIEAWLVAEEIDRSAGATTIPREVFRDFDYLDVDEDGRRDIVATVNYDQPRGVVGRWYRRMPGDSVTWTPYEIVSEGGLPFSEADGESVSKGVTGGDIDLDGQVDLVFSARGGEAPDSEGSGVSMYWLEYDPALGTADCAPCYNGEWDEFDIAPSYEIIKYDNVILADLDQDCDLDVVSAEENATEGSQGLGAVWYENEIGGAPVARCQNAWQTTSPGVCVLPSLDPSVVNNGSSDPDGTPLRLSLSPTGPFDLGLHTMTLTAGHACALKGGVPQGAYRAEDTCEATLTVVDRERPTLTCPPSEVLECNAPGGRTASFSGPTNLGDNCGAVQSRGCAPPSGTFLPVGQTQAITCGAMDESGNIGECVFTQTVRDSTRPTIAAPAALTGVECASATGTTIALGAANASDVCDATPAIANNAPALFPRGNTIVNWTATDDAINVSLIATQSVTVVDTTAPSISDPADRLGVECTSPSGASVPLSTPSVGDACDGSPAVSRAPSGDLFALGETPVTWTVIDHVGLSAAVEQLVTVVDTQGPVIATQPVVRECTSPLGTPVEVGAAVSDTCDPNPEVTNDAPALLPLGSTVVLWNAQDAAGNPAQTTAQAITIVDTAAPLIVCPGDMSLEPNAPEGVVVEFAATATDLCDAAPDVQCAPASGGAFAIGSTNPVTCTAVDQSNVQSSCGFVIEVLSLEGVLADLADRVTALRADRALNAGQARALTRHFENIAASLAAENGTAACDQLAGVTLQINDWLAEGILSPAEGADLLASIANLEASLAC